MENFLETKNRFKLASPGELARIRKGHYGMTQVEFAYLLGIKYETYRNWEKGKCRPSSPALAIIQIAKENKEFFLENRKDIIQEILSQGTLLG